jgi:O-antigen/teichoic acid export membrane protein
VLASKVPDAPDLAGDAPTAPMTHDKRREIERDVHASHLAGPVRVLLPTAVVFFTYPLLLRSAGIGVVGVWSILSSVLTYAGLLDIGFTGLLTREMAAGLPTEDDVRRIARWRGAARTVYVWGGVSLAASILLIASAVIAVRRAPITTAYPERSLLISVVAMVIAATLMLQVKLELTVFRAHHQTYVEQWSTALALVVTYLLGWVGILSHRPIEGLALGAVVAYGGALWILRAMGRHRFAEFFRRIESHARRTRAGDVRELVGHGRHLFGLNVAFVVREPVFRLALGAGLGVSAVGIYDIANRVPMLIRELGAAGAPSLLASISRLTRQEDKEAAGAIVASALRYSLMLGGVGLAVFAVNRALLFRLWLGADAPPELGPAALVMTVWWGITLLNAPFFWAMQARKLERQLSRAVALHIAGLLCAAPLLSVLHASLVGWLVAWTIAGLTTQVYLYLVAERRTGLVRPVLLTRSVIAFVVTSVAAATLGARLVPPFPHDRTATIGAIVFAALWSGGYLLAASPILLRWIVSIRHEATQASVPHAAPSVVARAVA